MSFAINPSLSYIDVPDESILEIHRSTSAVQLHDSGFKGHTCEAYLCICKSDSETRGYIALLETVSKSIFVYTSERLGTSPDDYSRVAAEADEHLKRLGFTMERVNLEFSRAMREVIIKGIRVMRPQVKKPPIRSMPQKKQQTPSLQEPARQVKSAISTPRLEQDSAEISSLRAELSSAKSAIEKITRDKVALEAAAAREITSLKSAAAKSLAALQAAEERCQAEVQALTEENRALRTPAEDLEKDELRRAATEAAAAHAELSESLEDLQRQLVVSEQERGLQEQRFSAESAAAKTEIARLKAENELLGSNLAAEQATSSSAMEKITALAGFENSWKEGQLREEELCRNLDALQQRIAELEEELGATSAKAAEQETGERPAEHAAAELLTLTAAMSDVEHEYIRLANESREKEEELLEALYAADEQIVRLQRELEVSAEVAAAEQEALRAELRQMIVAGAAVIATIETPAAVAAPPAVKEPPVAPAPAVMAEPVQAGRAAPEPAAEAQPAAAAQAEATPPTDIAEQKFDDDLAAPLARDTALTGGLVNEFGSFRCSGTSATEFSVAPGMDAIEYSHPGEVAALLYSSNSVQAMPDGKKSDRCKAFAVILNRSGNYSAFLAWYMLDNKRTVVCVPDHQPVDLADCTAILQDAVAYFEIVGFMMELEDLGENVGSCLKALHKIPALRRIKSDL